MGCSIGAKKVKAECTLFREYCRTANAEGCRKSFQQLKKEYLALRKKFEAYFQLARQVGPLESACCPRPFPPPQSSLAAQSQNPIAPSQTQQHGNWNYGGVVVDGSVNSSAPSTSFPRKNGYKQMPPNSSYHHHYQQFPYSPEQPTPTPPPETSYPAPPPPPANALHMYYPPNHYSQYSNQQPPSSPPPSSSIPPPPPPSSPPPASAPMQSRNNDERFRNEPPDPSAQPKLTGFKKEKDQYAKYTITSLEKIYKPKLFMEPDLGIPLDLLDLSVYNYYPCLLNPPSVRPPLDPEDEELLRDDEAITPIKKDGIKRKERPTDKGVAWLVKTQYISPLSMESTKQSLTEKQAKELREMKGGCNVLGNLNSRERQIKEIQASFEAAKSHPVHATKKDLYPVEVLPLLPDFDRYDDQFVVAAFDNAPSVDSEMYSKLDKSVRDAHESRAIMKSYVASGSDPANAEKFLAYMAPAPGELAKDIYDETEDVSYSWVHEYHWDVPGDDADDPTTYLVLFDESEARYLPLPTKLVLRKKRAKEGRFGEEVEQFPIPSRLTVRRRSNVAAIELKDSGAYSYTKDSTSSKRGALEIDDDDDMDETHRIAPEQDNYESSGAEDDMSE
ncbi:unnamed protein product [Lupinus luteus]|uniref:Uncharacterized protein n=1 Tax=Lupinus luteus TaxID=3873 RepID=A0AAV1YEF8_LUPLU